MKPLNFIHMSTKIKAFIAIWTVTTIVFLLGIIFSFSQKWITQLANYIYVLSLIYLFVDSDFLKSQTTHTEKLVEFKGNDIWGVLFIVIGISGLLLFIGLKTYVILVLAICTIIISIWLLIRFRSKITRTFLVNGLILGGLSALAMYKFIPSSLVIFLIISSTFIVGSILNEKFPLTNILINQHSFRQALKSFAMGCLFATPMALSNLKDTITTHTFHWIDQFWQPILALGAGIMEETWMRLFIILFIYALISAKTTKKYIPVITALLISSVFFGFGHSNYISIQNCLSITILYGFPMGILLIKRDFETAIGYHFMIDFIGAIGALASHM
jgi:membrane protease YdiL (CAAX protease family)